MLSRSGIFVNWLVLYWFLGLLIMSLLLMMELLENVVRLCVVFSVVVFSLLRIWLVESVCKVCKEWVLLLVMLNFVVNVEFCFFVDVLIVFVLCESVCLKYWLMCLLLDLMIVFVNSFDVCGEVSRLWIDFFLVDFLKSVMFVGLLLKFVMLCCIYLSVVIWFM